MKTEQIQCDKVPPLEDLVLDCKNWHCMAGCATYMLMQQWSVGTEESYRLHVDGHVGPRKPVLLRSLLLCGGGRQAKSTSAPHEFFKGKKMCVEP